MECEGLQMSTNNGEWMKRAWQRSEFRAERIASMNRPEVKTRHREAMKRVWLKPESRAAHIEALICPESWARLSGENNPAKKPEVRAKLSGENSAAWEGGTSFLPYCRKFNDIRREQVRNNYERICASCGANELFDGRRLAVYHVDGDKMQGCKRSDWFGLGGRWFLVPLCQSCHGKGLERDPYSVGMFWLAELARKYWERRVAA